MIVILSTAHVALSFLNFFFEVERNILSVFFRFVTPSTLGNIQTPTTEAATSLAAHDQRKATMISSSEESVLIDQQTIVDPTD